MTTICPLCRLSYHRAGRVFAFRDNADTWFSSLICECCAKRLDRLPVRLQTRAIDIAVGNLWKNPDRYPLQPQVGETEAKLYVQLEAARLRGEF